MNRITVLGIDLAKSVFQLHGVDERGKAILKRRVRRSEFGQTVATLAPCLIGMEACTGANYWARQFTAMGHEVKLMPPQYVKPYVKTNKNDASDAEAICEAVTRPTMRFSSIESPQQQEIQSLHRIRARGDNYLRSLLVHGARAALIYAPRKTDRLSQWVTEKQKSRGHNKACVALAKKNARMIWAIMAKGESYRMAA